MHFFFKSKRNTIVFVSVVSLVLIFLILQFFVLNFDLAFEIKMLAKYSYLFLLGQSANPVLSLLGSSARFVDDVLYSNGVAVPGFIPEIRYEKMIVILLVIIWLTKAPVTKKLLFTGLLVIAHFLTNSLNLIVEAGLAASNTQNVVVEAVANTVGLLLIYTLFFIWYRKFKDVILSRLSKFKINITLLKNDFVVILAAYLIIIVSSFLIEIFDFKLWISFIFAISKKILDLIGYQAVVDGSLMVGTKGQIMMSKPCLGFMLMLLFTIMIVLTGDNKRLRWIYIAAGIIVLNFINILRFVFLFVHLERHGDYQLLVEAHSLYNVITYVIVFLLWILWFEKFADAKKAPESPGELS